MRASGLEAFFFCGKDSEFGIDGRYDQSDTFSAHIRARISGYSGAVTRGTAVHPSETYAAGAISGHMSVVYTRACGKCRCRDSLNARTSATRLPAEVIRMLVFTLI